MNKEIKTQKTVVEAIKEIKSKMFCGEPLTTDTMLIALPTTSWNLIVPLSMSLS